jgi:hypothetical protein
VAFSCKGRGFCPSCGGRRMSDTAGTWWIRLSHFGAEPSHRYSRSTRSR